LKREIDVEIGFDANRPEQAAVDGHILSLTNPRSEMARGGEALATLLDSIHGPGRRHPDHGPAAAGPS
jgi:hypothetical protein